MHAKRLIELLQILSNLLLEGLPIILNLTVMLYQKIISIFLIISSKPHAYSDKAFWDSRYSNEIRDEQLYEWYIPLLSIKRLILDDYCDADGLPDNKFGSAVLLPGCGNSASGEELCQIGNYFKIIFV